MGKQIKAGLLLVVMVLAIMCPATAHAQTVVNKALLAEQAKGKAPNVKIYMTGSEMSGEVSMSGSVADVELTQNGDIKTFDETGEGLRYIILLDNSGSINEKQFKEAKKQLVKLRKNMKNNDEMQLYTVGTLDVTSDKTDVFGRTVVATETDLIDSDCDLIKNITYINAVDGKTILYRSLNEVLEAQSSQTSIDSLRTVIILVTDGEDDSDDVNGNDNDKDTTLSNVKNSSIPVYGILLNNTSKSPNKKKIKFTKNKLLDSGNSHGYYYNCTSKDSGSIVKKAFTKIDKILRNETYVVSLVAGTNKKIVGKNELNLTVNNQAIDPISLDYSDYEVDADAPILVGTVKKEGDNTISFTIDDANGVNLSDTKDKSHYTIEMDDGDGKTKNWTIEQASASPDGNSVKVTLTITEEEFYNGDYTVIVDGIRDESQDQNKMSSAKSTFTVEDGLNGATEARKAFVQKYWWIGLVVLVLILGIVVIIVVKKRSVKVVEMNPDELIKADSKMIRLTITDRAGVIKNVEWNVEGSLFVGRSDICNIFFDDDRLSKQHFVIEVTKMGCYIEDLESTNGTFVNGVKMTNRRLLLDGDIITAGREKIVFHIPKNQVFSGEISEG
jgi:uncharacterized protein YegL